MFKKISARQIIVCTTLLGLLALPISSFAQIAKNPAESNRVVALSLTSPSYFEDTQISEFAEISVTEDAFLYLIDFAPAGENSVLLAPSKLTPEVFLEGGRTYLWPRDFTSALFKVPAIDGDHTIEAVITPAQINLLSPPATSTETFTILGTDPDAISSNIETLIAAHGINAGSWSADFETAIIDPIPLSGSTDNAEIFADVRLMMLNELGNPISTDFSPKVRVDPDRPPASFVVSLDANQEGTRVIGIRRENTRVAFTPTAGFHTQLAPNPCQLNAGGIIQTRVPCQLTHQDLAFRGALIITFTLSRITDPAPLFNFVPTDIRPGEPVLFVASTGPGGSQVATYTWNFGDQRSASGAQSEVTHIYAIAGQFPVTLTIVTRDGLTITSDPKMLFVGSGTPVCQNQQPVQAGVCIDKLTGDFATHLFQDEVEVSGSGGTASVVFNILPQTAGAMIPEGPAIGEISYRIDELPAESAIRDGKFVADSRVFVHYINQNPLLSKTEPLDDPYVVKALQPAGSASIQVKSMPLVVPAGTVRISYQLFTNISLNETASKMELTYSGFRFESTACTNSFLKTDRGSYRVGSRIYFSFCNLTANQQMTLANTAPWEIRNSAGQVVFTPVAAQQIVTLKPQEYLIGEWDQITNGRAQAAPGIYTLEFRAGGALFTTQFVIEP